MRFSKLLLHEELLKIILDSQIAFLSKNLSILFDSDDWWIKLCINILRLVLLKIPWEILFKRGITLIHQFAIFTNLNIILRRSPQPATINSQPPMHTAIQHYLNVVNALYKAGRSTEHSYRGDLGQLISALAPKVQVTNEPTRISCGAPDYIITHNDIPIGYIEAKDIGKPLGSKEYKEQFDRYRQSLNNLIITDYLDFHLYVDGEKVSTVSIAEIKDGKVVPLPEKFAHFEAFIKDFCSYHGQTIKSSKKLAEMMAGKAKMLAAVIGNAVSSDEETNANSTLKEQMHAFKEILIHDIKPREFADIYAQTIAYGMFAARLHDATLPTFTRQEAAELIPKSNPFLRKLFQYIAGYDLDDRIKWIVDALADIFRATDVAALLQNFGKSTQQNDPIIHFYETFLSEYDPKLRKSRGVWYTPEPVVNFIVRAVDDILKTEFGLPMGLADTSKTTIEVDSQVADQRSKTGYKREKREVHRVQILDPATGTGTFLAEVIKQIHTNFEGQQGIWSKYVEDHLIPRLNGFELLMASYAMAHLKLDMLLTETGYRPTKDQRLRVYLTNSLEEYHKDSGTLFANWLSNEANEANHIKRDTPVMVVLGNPPYSVSSTNKGAWIESLVADYKKNLNEKNIQPLSDDYIKFIRYGQHFIEKNGEGILAYISNNSFIDGIIHRQMRKSLLDSFDRIYIIDLHGNAKKNETALDGTIDQNVFDIMQGVSINIFIKSKNSANRNTAKIFHSSIFGPRELKYLLLNQQSLSTIKWNPVNPEKPNYQFIHTDKKRDLLYNQGFSSAQVFLQSSSGVETRKDYLVTSMDGKILAEVIKDFKTLDEGAIEHKYQVNNDSRDWKISWAKNDVTINNPKIESILQKPFDLRKIIYTGKVKGIVGYPMFNNFKHFINHDNLGLISKRGRLLGNNSDYSHISITKYITDKNYLADQSYIFPLYLYPDNTQLNLDGHTGRVPNLNMDMVGQIAKWLGLAFVNEKNPSPSLSHGEMENPHLASPKGRGTLKPPLPQGEGWGEGHNTNQFAPIDLLDYIYAVLHSPAYREKYKEFLKIDFPRVPYPKDAAKFWQLVALGGQLRQLHLLESPVVKKYITQYPEDGDNIVAKPRYEGTAKGRVYINDSQYFDAVPLVAWEFYIGGYQPAQKWLKDRKTRTLTFEDILHYQQMIVALTETDRLMKEVDGVGVE